MHHRNLLMLLGSILIVLGLIGGGWILGATWLGCNFFILGAAHARGAHKVFGKRSDGTLPLWSRLAFLPLLAYTLVVWHLIRIFSREPSVNSVTDQLFVGRRLLACEVDDQFDNFVDLTAEFSEPSSISCSPSYRSFPILDGGAPTPEALHAAVAGLRTGRTFIHCAQGHGRTGLFALAVLLSSGAAQNVEDGLRILSAVRPTIHLSKEQDRCIRMYAQYMRQLSRCQSAPPLPLM